jgi:hypothetical protein
LIYLALALVGVVASAMKNKAKKQQQANRPHIPQVPRTLTADRPKEFEPDLGPLMELFDIPRPKQEPPEYETIESGESAEEAGMSVDTEQGSYELAGMNVDNNKSTIDTLESVTEQSFEEGQSDIQKMIAKYDALRKELDQTGMEDDIASGEIVSVEAEEAAKAKRDEKRDFFDPRKAIIYSEILKRREY